MIFKKLIKTHKRTVTSTNGVGIRDVDHSLSIFLFFQNKNGVAKRYQYAKDLLHCIQELQNVTKNTC